jgi:glycosyltransferase involved in cell wall biosynthesis
MTQAAEPLVSVVTPFYNAEPYLAECIESILGQNYRNFEHVLVNNCSTDRSAEKAQAYAERDARIRLVHNTTFLTQVQNLNHAVAQISPDSVYCKIVLADDFLFPTCLAEMVHVAQANPSVGMVGAYTLLGWKDRGSVYLDWLRYPSPVTPGREICRQFLLQGRFVTGSPTCTLIRSDFARSRTPLYNEESPVEDVDLVFDLLQRLDFGFVHQVLTYTRRENESIMSGWHTFGVLMTTEMIAIRKYGPIFLTPQELGPRRRAIEHRYFSFLGESVLRRRSAPFWQFHRRALRWSGTDLPVLKVAAYSLLAILSLVLNPLETLTRIGRRLGFFGAS